MTTPKQDLIERMAEAGRQNKGSIYTEMHAAARVMLEAMRDGLGSVNGWHTQFHMEDLATFERVLDAFAKENGLE